MATRPGVVLSCLLCLVLVAAAAYYAAVLFPLGSSSPRDVLRAANDSRPNILFVVIDDMGFNDLAVNGDGNTRTPHLDQLAEQGIRFTRNYVNASCTVSRVGMLTGLQPSTLGFRPDGLGIDPGIVTLPESLQAAGYSTHLIGKWHVGTYSQQAWPTEQGYDSFFGFLSQYALGGRHGGRGLSRHLVTLSEQYSGRGETVAGLVRRHVLEATRGAGWRFSLPTYHRPWLQYEREWPTPRNGHLSEIITERAESFIRQRRRGDPPWFLSFWTYAPHEPLQPMAEFAERYADTPEGKYLAMIEQVDASVGRLVDALEEQGLADNTLVFVVSDNGGTATHVPSNAPFKGGKTTFYEGGIRTPLLVSWPGRVAAGSVVDTPVTYLEYFPTLAAVAGAEIPASVTGRNLLAVAAGDQAPMAENLYWEFSNGLQHGWSVMTADGRWSLLKHPIGEPELYDLLSDPTQQENLAQEQTALAEALWRDYLEWRLRSRQVSVEETVLSGNGHRQLQGNPLQRAPGYLGYSLGIAVNPDANSEQAKQHIVYQRNQWQLALLPDRLLLKHGEISLQAPALEPGRCSSVVVTAYFNPGGINPAVRSSRVDLYVNGELADSHESDRFPIPADDYLRPTFIGQDDQGGNVFRGTLGRPVILNEWLVPEALSDARVGNGIHGFESRLCSTQSG